MSHGENTAVQFIQHRLHNQIQCTVMTPPSGGYCRHHDQPTDRSTSIRRCLLAMKGRVCPE